MWKYRQSFSTAIKNKPKITEEYIKTFLVRKPVGNMEDLHPRAKREFNRVIREPEPLTYKLKHISEKEANSFYEMSGPIGGTENIPFAIQRTHTNNLPVYTVYKSSRTIKMTVVRHIRGDVEEFKRELTKIVSNSEITDQMGKVMIKGMHAEKVKLWLRRLGF